jgi:hypothetical protein
MRHSEPARALLFVADLTSREQFLSAFGPYATAQSILVVTHRSELPETGDRLVFRLALADGETMLAGEALVTRCRGTGRRGVVRLEPTRLDPLSRAIHRDLVARARPLGGDRMDEAMEKLAECHVLEEAQAIGVIDSGTELSPPRAITAPAVVAEVEPEPEPLPPPPWRLDQPEPRRRSLRGAALAALCAAALLAAALALIATLR